MTLREKLKPLPGAIFLQPSLAFEGEGVAEPSLINDGDTLRFYYSALQDDTIDVIGYASSPNMETPFTKRSTPVVGHGFGGAPSDRNAQGSCFFKFAGTYYGFCTNGYGNAVWQDKCVYGYTSANGVDFTSVGKVLDLSLSPGSLAFGNTTIIINQHDGTPHMIAGKYQMFLDIFSAGSVWETHRLESASLLAGWTIVQKITTLQVNGMGAFGNCSVKFLNGVYHNFYLYAASSGNLPCYLAYATSVNLNTWTIKEAPFLGIEAQPYGAATDQIADVIVEEVNGKTYVIADYCQNFPVFKSELRRWTFNGTFAQFVDENYVIPFILKAFVAAQNISFVAAGINAENTSEIHQVQPKLKSYVPGRDINPLKGFEADKGYFVIIRKDLDLSEWIYAQ